MIIIRLQSFAAAECAEVFMVFVFRWVVQARSLKDVQSTIKFRDFDGESGLEDFRPNIDPHIQPGTTTQQRDDNIAEIGSVS
jgi:hypothetical protein